MKQSSLVVVALLSGLVASCGSARQTVSKAPVAPAEPIQVVDTKGKGATDVASKSQVVIAENIRKECGITAQDAHFSFDSAAVRTQDTKVLKQVADCFGSGPLRGRMMRLVGHADPRGDDEYNMVLGGRRAENVKQYIARAGLGLSRMEASSRGKMDASGHDEDSWATDRRVDLMLAN